jgi:Glycosyl transferase 4-like domain
VRLGTQRTLRANSGIDRPVGASDLVREEVQSSSRNHQTVPVQRGDRIPSFQGGRFIFYVVDWLPPDFGAVGQYAVGFAREMAESGRKVSLVGLTGGVGAMECENMPHGGVLEISRLPTKAYNKSALIGRLIWSLRANLKLIWRVGRDPRSRGADVLFTGSPPFMLFFAVFTKWFRGARLIYHITDFYPEVIIAARGKRHLALAVLERLTWFLRRRVDAFLVLGEDQRRLLIAGGVAPERITLKRYGPPIAISGREKPARRPAGLTTEKVLLYSGNYGVAHEIETVVKGLIQHHQQGTGKFGLWLSGTGCGVESIMLSLSAAGIPFAHSEPVALGQLPSLLAAADIHLITLRSGFSGLVVPSKVYGCLQSRRPILFVGPESSDVHLLCSQAIDCRYERVEPGDVAAFAAALERLARPAV